ncbi:MAG TPA: quinone-dependent dihydroorotate dehydrogenase [Verrucomicrobiae bacterium]
MSWFYRNVVRPVLFNYDSEEIHDVTLGNLARFSRSRIGLDLLESFYGTAYLPMELFGLRFPNPVGLAAGMDKQGVAVPAWAAFGFGFSELGGVTWHPQPGNDRPRMFRAVSDDALVNRMGFNNGGAEALAERLASWKESGFWPKHPVGINLGKSKVTALEKAAEDYANSFRLLRDLADFFVVNVSSPNTPNLRQLQDRAALDEILRALQRINSSGVRKPVLVKVAPDLSFEALNEIVELAGQRELAGIVATNTTVTRPSSPDERCARAYSETGGLSGRPLRERSSEVIRHIYLKTGGKLPIIGVGGIFNAQDAWEKITAGASLVQVYTGMVYEGPGIARSITEGLTNLLAESGMKSLSEAVGITAKARGFPAGPKPVLV